MSFKRDRLCAAICEILFVVWINEYHENMNKRVVELTTEWEAPGGQD